jgi:hypothetical protein
MPSEDRRFGFASSIAVYGAGRLPMRNDFHEDPYGVSKHAFVLDLAAVQHVFARWGTGCAGPPAATARRGRSTWPTG